jgi:limonene-1,2-epoxide hydrolase
LSDLAIVLGFLQRMGGGRAPDARWVNVGVAETIGPKQALAFLDSFREALPIEAIDVDVHAAAEGGGVVFVERTDRMRGDDRRELKRVDAVGAFEIRDGRIQAWRDYWDTSRMTRRGS